MLPWKEISPEDEQIGFVQRWQAGEVTFVELCRAFGISRKPGYKRVRRFQSYGWEGVGDRSRFPRCHPNSTPLAVAQRLILAWWGKLGIIPERIEPGHPEQNGRL